MRGLFMSKLGYFLIQGFVLNALSVLIMYITVLNLESFGAINIKFFIFLYMILIIMIGTLLQAYFSKTIEEIYPDKQGFPYEIFGLIIPAIIFVIVGFFAKNYFSFALFAISLLMMHQIYCYVLKKRNDRLTMKIRILIHLAIVSTISLSTFLLTISLNY